MQAQKLISRSEAYELADWYAEHDAQDSLPSDVLAVGHRWHVWWRPSEYRGLHVNQSVSRLHVPAMVFASIRNHVCAFALYDDARPDDDTRLFVAPFPGLGLDGLMRHWRPGTESQSIAECIEHAMRVFDATALMTIDGEREPPCKHPKGAKALWVEMAQRRWKRFPVRYLIQNGYTVGTLIERIRADRFRVWMASKSPYNNTGRAQLVESVLTEKE